MSKEVIQCITEFIKGGDESNLVKLDKVLHTEFRNIQSGFFVEKGLFIIDKKKYLFFVSEKNFWRYSPKHGYNLLRDLRRYCFC